ncbi:MAG: hypothetical protein HQ592_09025, partial [Planctomycetes bacterium]|nr:hypothetical protein [Planctomycetota bacterium]
MAAILINSASGTGGESSRFLRSKQNEIIGLWLERAAAIPPHRAIGPPQMVDEIANLLPAYISAVLERIELGSYGGDPSTLRPMSERAAAAAVPIGSL